MQKAYSIIRYYLLNGMYSYALFGLYALTISPLITKYIDYGQKSTLVAVIGLTIYVAEFFAINFKIRMIRLRTEIRRREYKDETGIDVVPRPGKLIFLGLMFRIALRTIILMVSLTALGIHCSEKEMSTAGQVLLITGIFLDVFGFVYIYVTTGFYNELVTSWDDWYEMKEDNEKWYKKNLALSSTPKFFAFEVISDIVLQLYAFILFTAIWHFLNQSNIEIIKYYTADKLSNSNPVLSILPRLLAISLIWVMPIRIAYWLEDSMMAFSTKEKICMIILFAIVSISTIGPTISLLITLHTGHSYQLWEILKPENINLTLSIFLITSLILIRLVLSSVKTGKSVLHQKA